VPPGEGGVGSLLCLGVDGEDNRAALGLAAGEYVGDALRMLLSACSMPDAP
jgi:hypothetical protein